MMSSLLWLIPVLPLIGFLVNGTAGRRMPNPAVAAVAVGAAASSFALAVLATLEVHDASGPARVYATWIATGSLEVPFGLAVDPLSAVLLLNVTGVGAAIHLYSYGYMHEDPGFARFMAYLNLFLAAMIVLVMADGLLLLFVGWEGVGLCSYLLIGFWFSDRANADAGIKAFVVNRVGDLAFLVGAFTLYALAGSLQFAAMEEQIGRLDPHALLTSGPFAGWSVHAAMAFAGACLFGGMTGKSAQIPLYVWLPDAMAGPTPVSALIHAATMVTAGVYLLGRMDFLYVHLPEVTVVIAVVAAATALLSGVIALGQNDIKKVLAYSTVSQLGYMFAGTATMMWGTGVFHLVTHAFFKALLFLGAGAVIVAMHHEQDMRKMGGLARDLRPVFVVFGVGALALAGVPPLAGFFSKDEILGAVHLAMAVQGGAWTAVFWVLVLTAGLTALYTTRMVAMTFFGEPHDSHRHLHAVHPTMMGTLVVLAVLSALGGLLGSRLESFTHPVFTEAEWVHATSHEVIEHSHHVAMGWSVAAVVVGIALGVLLTMARPAGVTAFLDGPGRSVRQAVEDRLYVDELYAILIVGPVQSASALLFRFVDRLLIDGSLVEGTGRVVLDAGGLLRRTQLGVVSVATAGTVVGALLILLLLVATGA